LWAVFGAILIGYWIYTEFVAPIFGLPTIGP
jgi:hypothetical protein